MYHALHATIVGSADNMRHMQYVLYIQKRTEMMYMYLCHGEQVDQREKVGYKSSTAHF